jgi:hypothetical protein
MRVAVGCHPWLFYPLYGLVPVNRQLSVRRDIELVIEGFPRSANTFAVLAFQQAQTRKVGISHHMHVPAQIIRASHWGIPAIVLVRNPKDAVASYIMRKPELSIRDALNCYTRFYKSVYPYRNDYITATFEEIISDFSSIICRVNSKFNTKFVESTPKDSDLEKIFRKIDSIESRDGIGMLGASRPSSSKNTLKKQLLEEINSFENRNYLSTAESTYLKFIS